MSVAIPTCLLNKSMKKSTKILVGGTFLIGAFFGAEAIFASLGLAFGLPQMAGSAVAGLAGALKLTA